jgi:hypothetical protein
MNSKCIVFLTASAITYLLHYVSLPAAQAYLRKMPPQAAQSYLFILCPPPSPPPDSVGVYLSYSSFSCAVALALSTIFGDGEICGVESGRAALG